MPSAGDEKSLAVLAFACLSADPEAEHFSDGLCEDLIGMLGRIPGLMVKGRTSAFYFKGRNVPMPEIARQLGVTYVLRGSVRKSGPRVRIIHEAIDGAGGQPAAIRDAREPAERAVQLDPTHPDSLTVLAAAHLYEGDFEAAGRRFREALAINPNSSFAHLWYGTLFSSRGRLTAASAEYAKAIELDPLWFAPLQLQAIAMAEAGRFRESPGPV